MIPANSFVCCTAIPPELQIIVSPKKGAMSQELSCFVIIGYNKKPSYANNRLRLLDLNETYDLLIKPVLDQLNIDCYRAIDKNLNCSIDEVMLQEIQNASIAIADLTTLNANVMWELGVRHTLKPHHTIMICEKEQMSSLPFDVNRFVVHEYIHSEEGIPFREVERFRSYLTHLIKGMLGKTPPQDDSPVFQFLQSLHPRVNPQPTAAPPAKAESFASLMAKAAAAQQVKDYATAIHLYEQAKIFAKANMTLRDNLSLVICNLALCTYKLKAPNELQALLEAALLLGELTPDQSQDVEVLGLSGAVNKRLYELTGEEIYADNALLFYERGFKIKQDYYNGINATYMLLKKTATLQALQQPWEDTKLKADYTRNAVLDICRETERRPGFDETSDAVWVLYSMAEAWHYKRNEAQVNLYEQKAKAFSNHAADESYAEQKKRILSFVDTIKS